MSEPLPVLEYERVNWEDAPSRSTPLSADNLNNMDNAIAALCTYIYQLEEQVIELGGLPLVIPITRESGNTRATTVPYADIVEAYEQNRKIRIQFDGNEYDAITVQETNAIINITNIGGVTTTEHITTELTILFKLIPHSGDNGIDVMQAIYYLFTEGDNGNANVVEKKTVFTGRPPGTDAGKLINSYVGMVISSMTLNTKQKVIEVYGGTDWTQLNSENYYVWYRTA